MELKNIIYSISIKTKNILFIKQILDNFRYR